MDRKTFLCIFVAGFLFVFEKLHLQKTLEKQKGSFVKTKARLLLSKQNTSFVSPSTKEQQRKSLLKLTFFAY